MMPRSFGGAILLLKLLSVVRFAVGVLDHALREAPELLVQIRAIVSEMGAQVFDIHFLLHILHSDETVLQGVRYLIDDAVEQTQFEIQEIAVVPGGTMSGNDRDCVKLRESPQAVRMLA